MMFKPKKIILLGALLIMAQSIAAKALVVDQMLVDLEKNCQNYEQLYQYQELKSHQQHSLQNAHTEFHYDSNFSDIGPYLPLKLTDQCQQTQINNQIELAQHEKQQRTGQGQSSEIVIDLDLLVYRSLKSLYDEQAYSTSDIEQLKVAIQDIQHRIAQHSNRGTNAYLPIIPLMLLLKYDLHYSPVANRKIFEANQQFHTFFEYLYTHSEHQYLSRDFQQVVPLFIARFDYSNKAYQLITAIQRNDLERVKVLAESYSQLYANQTLADEFHQKYPVAWDFDEVIRKEAVAELLTYAFYKLNDRGNVQKWIERADLIGTSEVSCTTKTLVDDPHLNTFLKQDQVWYRPKFEKQMSRCNEVFADTKILSKFDLQKVMDNYEQHCGAMYAEKIPLLQVQNSKFIPDYEFHSVLLLMRSFADLEGLSARRPATDQCIQTIYTSQIDVLQYYLDHMQPTASGYQDAKDELVTLRKQLQSLK